MCKAFGYRCKASIYSTARAGLFTKPVRVGNQATGWPDYEVDAIIAARVAGQPIEAIRALVNHLHAQRAERFKALMAPTPATSASPATATNVVPLGRVAA